MSEPSVVAFGEAMLRLSAPGHELLGRTPSLDVHVGGKIRTGSNAGNDDATHRHAFGDGSGRLAVRALTKLDDDIGGTDEIAIVRFR